MYTYHRGDATGRGVQAAAPSAVNKESDTDEPQRSPFSWAEFMAEPTTKTKGHYNGGKPSLSLFEWAVSIEQQRVEEEEVEVPAYS